MAGNSMHRTLNTYRELELQDEIRANVREFVYYYFWEWWNIS